MRNNSKSKTIQFILLENYRVLLGSSVIEGTVFLVLFLLGIARYRFALVFIARGMLSAIYQYYKNKGAAPSNLKYWQIINSSFIGLFLLMLIVDISEGQIYPIYPDLPFSTSLISVGLGYFIAIFLHRKIGSALQGMSGDMIFLVCPQCGYANKKIVEKCINCKYEQGISGDGQEEKIARNRKAELYDKMPVALIRGVKLESDESVLSYVKAPSIKLGWILKNGEKNLVNRFGEMCTLNRIILTNSRICFASEMLAGWKAIYCHAHTGVNGINITNKKITSPLMDKAEKMTIRIDSDEYTLKGFNPEKLFISIETVIEQSKKDMGSDPATYMGG